MSTKSFNFTKAALDALVAPEGVDRVVVRDTKQKGLELRVTARGAKTFSLLHRVRGGKVERVSIGPYPDVSIDQARDRVAIALGQHALGVSHAAAKKKQANHNTTFGDALKAFIDDDTARDAPLKDRTRLDYLNMIRSAGKAATGHEHGPGELHAIAGRKLDSLTGIVLKTHYKLLAERSAVRAGYAMRVARAVLKYNGVKMDDDPFDAATARRDRIVIPAAGKRTRTIPFERIADWWRAAEEATSGDAFQLLLLTGMRRGELAGLTKSDVDLHGGRLHLRDTKNRKSHVILLSTQAHRLVRARAANKEDDDLLFAGAADPRKSLEAIIAATGIPFSAHDCRRTFATIAAARLPGYVVKRLMNHSDGGDVTAAHYVHLDENTLRVGWQVVADAILPPGTVSVATGEKVVSLASMRKTKAA